MDRVRTLIVGAGPTGLGAAWRLGELGDSDWRLIEGSDHAGGLATSVLDEHGFTWDLGGHVQFSHYTVFDDLMDDLLGVDGWIYHDRESWVWIKGRFVPYPFQLNIHRLPTEDRDACLAGLERAQTARDEAPANFGEWIDRSLGAGIAHLFMRPYNEKVWARPPELMSWRWIGDRVAVVDLERVKANVRFDRDDVSWGPNNRFRFPKRGGTGAVWTALANRLSAAHPRRLRFSTRLTRLDTAARRAHLGDGSVMEYERLVSTIPLDVLVEISDLAAALTPAARRLERSSTHVIGIGLRGQAPAHLRGKCWMYFPEGDNPFYRVTHFSHYSPQNVPHPGRQWSLMAEVSESRHKPVDSARVVEDTIAGLVATRMIRDRSEVHHTWHRRIEHGYPVPSLDRDAAITALRPALEARQVFSRGRFGAWMYEVSNQDHSFAQGVEVVDRLTSGAVEETLTRPDHVNARRPAPRAAAS